MVTPTLVWNTSNITPYSNNPSSRTTDDGVLHVAPLILEGSDDGYYPTIFRDTKGRKENNCIHAKPLAFPGSRLSAYTSVSYGGTRYDGFFESLIRKERYGYGGVIAWQAFHHYTVVVSVNGNSTYPASNLQVYFITYDRWGTPPKYRYDVLYSMIEWERPSPDQPFMWRMRYNRDSWFQASAPWPYGTEEEIKRANNNLLSCLRFAESFGLSMVSSMRLWSHLRLGEARNTTSSIETEPFQLTNPFILGEETIFDGLLSSDPGANYTRNWLIQHAYKDALDNMPTLSDNTISNIFEFGAVIVKWLTGNGLDIPKSLSSAWLSYRYQYNTTKSDVQEAAQFFRRKVDLEGLKRGVKTYGMSSYTFKGTSITCRCRINLRLKYIDALDDLVNKLYMYGLLPDLYILWDMTPFSFVADWFLPIGDILSLLDKEGIYSPWTYDISSVTVSLSYQTDGHKCYSRFETGPINLNGFYWFDRPQTSDRVRLFRILDGASLIVH